MISFLLCLAILIVGYFVYGKIVDNTFGPDDRETPAVRINDGVDYVVMPQWKLFLVQLLNIAGLGPIFGAMQGALWGPVVFLWITFGTIFAGGVHDYFSGMMSERNDGASIAEITGKYLGPVMQNVMRVFSVVLLIMVGTVFAVGPAGLIVELCQSERRFRRAHLAAVLAHHHPGVLLYRDLYLHRRGHWQDLPHLRHLPDHHGHRRHLRHLHQSLPTPSRRSGITSAACIRRAPPSGASCSSRWPAVRSPASTPPSRP